MSHNPMPLSPRASPPHGFTVTMNLASTARPKLSMRFSPSKAPPVNNGWTPPSVGKSAKREMMSSPCVVIPSSLRRVADTPPARARCCPTFREGAWMSGSPGLPPKSIQRRPEVSLADVNQTPPSRPLAKNFPENSELDQRNRGHNDCVPTSRLARGKRFPWLLCFLPARLPPTARAPFHDNRAVVSSRTRAARGAGPPITGRSCGCSA